MGMSHTAGYSEEKGLRLAREWTRVGGGFTVPAATAPVDLEELLIRSVQAGPADYRVFFVAATWLGVHEAFVDMRKFAKRLAALDGMDSAVAGALVDLARLAGGSAALSQLAARCRALDTPRPLFDANAQNLVLRDHVEAHPLPIFARWGLWHDEISLKHGAIRPVQWILKHCPELRVRALVGTGLDAEVLQSTWSAACSITELSEKLGTSYAATHEAVERLLHRGLVTERREANRRLITVTQEMRSWVEAYPQAQVGAAQSVAAVQSVAARTRRG